MAEGLGLENLAITLGGRTMLALDAGSRRERC